MGKAFLHLSATAIRPKSRLGEALHYALGQREAMKTYLYDGRVAIDNNHTERDIRPGVIGRKNWLFIGHPEAGSRAAALYSILISALNHGVNPQAYLEDIIRRLPAMRTDDLDALLPEAWAAANRERHPAAGAPAREPAVTRQPAAA